MQASLHVLIVSPRFPPSSAPDSQRVRMLLPHLASCNITAEVIAVDPLADVVPLDPWQSLTVPDDIPVHLCSAYPIKLRLIPGLGSLESRSYHQLKVVGDSLLATGRFDLVFFSTTAFGFFPLGPRWRRLYDVPFILDFQDPWVNDFYRKNPNVPPPGGRLKYFVADRIHRVQEPRTLRTCSGLIAVSQSYISEIAKRYTWTSSIPSVVLPFPGEPNDFKTIECVPHTSLPFTLRDNLIHWISVGRVDSNLFSKSLHSLFASLRTHAPKSLLDKLRIHFVGTSYAPSQRGNDSVVQCASMYGLDHIVTESSNRIPLSNALASLKAADALLVFGSNDPSYTASKIYPYLLARRPLLVIVHKNSSVCSLIDRCGGAQLASFDSTTRIDDLADDICEQWLTNHKYEQTIPLNHSQFQPHTAASQAKQLADFFFNCLTYQR